MLTIIIQIPKTDIGGNSGSGLIASSYLSEDADITGAESAYVAMEAELQDMLDNIESEYPGYDEYQSIILLTIATSDISEFRHP